MKTIAKGWLDQSLTPPSNGILLRENPKRSVITRMCEDNCGHRVVSTISTNTDCLLTVRFSGASVKLVLVTDWPPGGEVQQLPVELRESDHNIGRKGVQAYSCRSTFHSGLLASYASFG
jgi:hypothetical protein